MKRPPLFLGRSNLPTLFLALLSLGLTPVVAQAGGYYGEDRSDDVETDVDFDDIDMDSGTEIDLDSSSESTTPISEPKEYKEPKSYYEYDYDSSIETETTEIETVVEVEPEPESAFGRNYLGGVYRGAADGVNNQNDFGVTGKFGAIKLSETASVSWRPAAYFGDQEPLLRNNFTVDGKISENLTGYVGGGFETDFDGDDSFQGVVTAGLDVHVNALTIGGSVDYLTDDDEFEAKATVGFSF